MRINERVKDVLKGLTALTVAGVLSYNMVKEANDNNLYGSVANFVAGVTVAMYGGSKIEHAVYPKGRFRTV